MKSDQLGDTLLPKYLALPIFASDALSSNAYATQEILLVLSLGGAAFYGYTGLIAGLVIFTFFVVVASYRQNVHAYPSGGGDYEVVSTNLGQRAGVFVAAALLIDYVMTVAVSIASAVANLASAFPAIHTHKTMWAVLVVLFITAMNLRGVRESGSAFAIPVYGFMLGVYGMILLAIYRLATGGDVVAESAAWHVKPSASFTGMAVVFLVARAFSSGTTALTGIEAISNGVPAFRKPKSKNAATTLLLLGGIATTMFGGITWLAVRSGVQVTDHNADLIGLPAGAEQKTVIAQVADAVFQSFSFGFFYMAAVTAIILALAANTAFNGFPVLGSVLARDGYMPKQLHNRGDRLAFSNGIFVLAGLASVLLVIYQAEVTKLIQLYILGVFVSFTLSQLGMIRHWTRLLLTATDPKERARMRRSRIINAVGFVCTGLVLVIVLVTKFTHGAYLVVIAMPILYAGMRGIRKHYDKVADEIEADPDERVTLPSRVHAIVLVSRVHKATLRAVAYARATRPSSIEAVTVSVDEDSSRALVEDWNHRDMQIPLRVLASPYREITRPIIDYVRSVRRESPRDLVAVYIPQFVVGSWWEQILHNQSAIRLRARLLYSPNVTIVSVPWQLASSSKIVNKPEHDSAGAVRRGHPDAETEEREVARQFGIDE
jgi:amino acid transporter